MYGERELIIFGETGKYFLLFKLQDVAVVLGVDVPIGGRGWEAANFRAALRAHRNRKTRWN